MPTPWDQPAIFEQHSTCIQSLDQINTVDDPAFGKYHIACHMEIRTYLKNKIRVQE